MPDAPVRYRSDEEDSGRWSRFPFRAGDIVISTRSKCGTTWMQMICALLIFQTAELPGTLPATVALAGQPAVALDERFAGLAEQRHRRFIKTHTPLDGIPLDPRATYIVVARHPLDMAVSLYHQGNNIDRARLRSAHRPARTGRAAAHRARRCMTGSSAGSMRTPRPSGRWTRCPG